MIAGSRIWRRDRRTADDPPRYVRPSNLGSRPIVARHGGGRRRRAAVACCCHRGKSSPTDLKNPALYINRELSWLEFNERVLAQARDTVASAARARQVPRRSPARNLDEFFMIRVSTTLKKLREGIEDVAPDGYNTEQQLEAMRQRARRMLQDQAAVWDELRQLLEAEQISFLERDEWTPEIREHLTSYFSREICPVLTPLAFDPGHPFPFISNLSKNFAVVVRHGGRTKFARVKVPDVLPRFVAAAGAAVRARHGELRVPRGRHPRQHARAVPGHAGEGRAPVPRHPRRRPRDRRGRSRRPARKRRSQPEAAAARRASRCCRSKPTCRRASSTSSSRTSKSPTTWSLRTTDRLGFGDWMQLTRIHRPELKDAPFPPRTLWRADEDPEAIFD